MHIESQYACGSQYARRRPDKALTSGGRQGCWVWPIRGLHWHFLLPAPGYWLVAGVIRDLIGFDLCCSKCGGWDERGLDRNGLALLVLLQSAGSDCTEMNWFGLRWFIVMVCIGRERIGLNWLMLMVICVGNRRFWSTAGTGDFWATIDTGNVWYWTDGDRTDATGADEIPQSRPVINTKQVNCH